MEAEKHPLPLDVRIQVNQGDGLSNVGALRPALHKIGSTGPCCACGACAGDVAKFDILCDRGAYPVSLTPRILHL